MGEALRGAGDRGCEPVDHGAASPSTQPVNSAEPVSVQSATEPSEFPDYFPQVFELAYLRDTKTLFVDYFFPRVEDLPSVKSVRYIQTQAKLVETPLSESARNKLYEDSIYQVTLRLVHELFAADRAGSLDAIVFNGGVETIDKSTGRKTSPCILSIQVSKGEFQDINLEHVEPKPCFRKLKGVSAAGLYSLTPIAPVAQFSRDDKRFVESYDVAGGLDDSVNLASMDWEDFEHLIRELFAKEFSGDGGEVKVTQASRDGGVDAVVFDPDPIRGGKIVIQAKRYTNVVGVSAVRDLYGTVMNEGANKGILVTTAHYGSDAYDFAKGKPLTLLDGGNLLSLLAKHGHKARINTREAKTDQVNRKDKR
jgi:restriction system protein